MREAIRRILSSQKAIYAMIPVLANTVAGLAGVDPTQPILLTLDAVFALLLLAQFALDMRWGSPSDKSGAFRNITPLLLAGVLLSGCAFSGALYSDKKREVLPVKTDGASSFCFAGLTIGGTIVVLPAFGWGELSCGDVISPGSGGPEDAEE